jgi:hypothetical protein
MTRNNTKTIIILPETTRKRKQMGHETTRNIMTRKNTKNKYGTPNNAKNNFRVFSCELKFSCILV